MSDQFIKIKKSLPKDIRLLVVTKSQSVERILPILQQGHNCFGENKVQEAYKKWFELKKSYPMAQLHMIGHLQTNKVKQALQIFDVIESLDRFSLAKELAKCLKNTNRCLKIFIEVNIGAEVNKSGVSIEQADSFIEYCKEKLHLPIVGIMIIPPALLNPVPFFKLAQKIQKRHNLAELSMGMSNDYEQAIVCGTTEVRIGSKIFD